MEVPFCTDYGDPSSDDLSSEWDSDVAEPQPKESLSKIVTFKVSFRNVINNFREIKYGNL